MTWHHTTEVRCHATLEMVANVVGLGRVCAPPVVAAGHRTCQAGNPQRCCPGHRWHIRCGERSQSYIPRSRPSQERKICLNRPTCLEHHAEYPYLHLGSVSTGGEEDNHFFSESVSSVVRVCETFTMCSPFLRWIELTNDTKPTDSSTTAFQHPSKWYRMTRHTEATKVIQDRTPSQWPSPHQVGRCLVVDARTVGHGTTSAQCASSNFQESGRLPREVCADSQEHGDSWACPQQPWLFCTIIHRGVPVSLCGSRARSWWWRGFDEKMGTVEVQ